MNASNDSPSPYQLRTPVEIAAVIRGLLADRILISVFWGHAEDMFVTRVLSVDAESGSFVIDGPKDGRTNVGIRRATSLRFEATHRQIKIRFSCAAAKPIDFERRPGFQLGFPQTAVRIQRRSDFRAKTPVLASPTLSISSFPTRDLRSVRVTDISCGGLAFNIQAQSAPLEAGARLDRCTLQLPDSSEAEVSIEVRHVEPFTDGVGRSMHRLGCQYRSLPLSMSALIRRYINQLEVERRQER
jgi:flagellar brake protein